MKYSLFITSLVIIQVLYAQNPYFEWGKSFGGSSSDIIRSVDVDSFGNVHSTGVFNDVCDFDPGIGTVSFNAGQGSDIFVQKLDNNGNLVWVKTIGGSSLYGNAVGKIVVDNQGNVYVTGAFRGTVDFDPGIGVYNLTSSSSVASIADQFILKLDINGDFLWVKQFDYKLQFRFIEVDTSQNLYLTGDFTQTVDFDPGTGTSLLTATPGSPFVRTDIFIQKLNTNGDFLWAKSFGGIEDDQVTGFTLHETEGLYLTGVFQGISDLDPGSGVLNQTSLGGQDFFIQKTDLNGDLVWAKSIGGVGNDYSNSIDTDNLGNLVVCGSFASTVDFNPGIDTYELVSTNGIRGFIEKLDVNGDFIWAKPFDANAYPKLVAFDSFGSIHSFGRFSNISDLDLGTGSSNLISNGARDIFIQKMGAEGEFLYAKSIGTGEDDIIPAVKIDASDNIYLASSFESTLDLNPNAGVFNVTSVGSYDSYVLKLSQCTKIGVDYQVACSSYTWVDGSTYATSNNTATYTLTNAAGCDSIVTLNLTINNSSTSTTDITECDAYTWNGTTYTASGTYTWTGTNSVGCDSIATLNLTINNGSTSTTDITECGAYTWNGTTYTTSGTYTWTGTNSVGCDSIATLNLMIYNSSTSTIDITECGAYTWNGTTYTTSGAYTWTGTNSVGCDSTATLNLTINDSSTSTTDIIECDAYTWNGTTYTTSGAYTWTGTNSVGCDSTATLNLTINNSSTSTTDITECDAYTWNGTTYTTSGAYTWAGTNSVGCDSIATLNLTINDSSTSTTDIIECDAYTWNGTTYTTNGTYTWTGTNSVGCDSTATLNLTINNSSTSTTDITECDAYTWNGTTYTTSGTYIWTGTNSVGCDSSATLNLIINAVDNGISITGITITANTEGINYQWIDCFDDQPILGETSQSFTPTLNGDYAVILTDNNCTDTSICTNINTVSLHDFPYSKKSITISPNPTNGLIFIESKDLKFPYAIKLYNVSGKILNEYIIDSDEIMIDLRDYSTGVYYLKTTLENRPFTERVIRN